MPDAVGAVPTAQSSTIDQARQAYEAAQATKGPAQELDGEVFLQLLVTQLQNQDPSSPMDTNQMISQAAQLSMTETLNKISASLESQNSSQGISLAASLIGREVEWTLDGIRSTGTVESAMFQDGKNLLEIDGQFIDQTLITALPAAKATDEN